MAEDPTTLLGQLMRQRNLGRQELLDVLHRRATTYGEPTFTLSLRSLDRWLAGELATQPRPIVRRVLEKEFGHPIAALLGPATPGASSPGVAELVDAAALSSAEFGQWLADAGTRPHTLQMARLRLEHLASAYVSAPIGPVFAELVTLRDDLVGHLRRPDPAASRELYFLAGATCAILAHASGNLGNLTAAALQTQTALMCADHAGYPRLAAWALGVRGLQAEWNGNPEASLRLLDEAEQHLHATTTAGTTEVWLSGIRARAHARRGNVPAMREALQRAERLRDLASSSSAENCELDALGGIFTFTTPKQDFYAGTSFRRGGQMPEAARHAAAAITGYQSGPASQRSYGDETLAYVDLAIACATGPGADLDRAGDALHAIGELPVKMRAPALIGPLGDLDHALTGGPAADSPRARHLREQVRAIITTHEQPALTT